MAENFVRNPSLEKLNRLRKDELVEAGKRLELDVRPAMRKNEVRRIILEHLVDNEICDESALEELAEVAMSNAQLELEKTKILAEADIEKTKIIQEARIRELAIRQEGPSERREFEVARHVKLVPRFTEQDVDQYFSHFEKTATNLQWPKQHWSMLLQTALCGKAQRVYASLSVQECADYDVVKRMILQGYELVPEVYRQKFRICARGQAESHMEFARRKEGLLDRWCTATKVGGEYERLRQLILVEEFLKDLPEDMRLFLNERKASTIHEAARLADEYTANRHHKLENARSVHELAKMADEHEGTHRDREMVPTRVVRGNTPLLPSPDSSSRGFGRPRPSVGGERMNFRQSPKFQQQGRREPPQCFKCHQVGHLIANCPRRHEADVVACVVERPQGMAVSNGGQSSYRPYISRGSVSTTDGKRHRKLDILRDTGASHSLIRRDALPDGDRSYTGRSIAVRGVENKVKVAPIYRIRLCSKWKTGNVDVAAVDRLPVYGVSILLGNDHGPNPWTERPRHRQSSDSRWRKRNENCAEQKDRTGGNMSGWRKATEKYRWKREDRDGSEKAVLNRQLRKR